MRVFMIFLLSLTLVASTMFLKRAEKRFSLRSSLVEGTFLQELEKSEDEKNPSCCKEGVHVSKLKRDAKPSLNTIKEGFQKILEEIPSFYVGDQINVQEYELRYILVETKAVALLSLFFCQGFPESEEKERVYTLVRKVSDEFETLIKAHQEAIRPRGSEDAKESARKLN